MIAAFDVIALDPSHRQGKLAMGTGIFKCCELTILQTVKDDVFAEHRYGCQVAPNFMIPRSDVPSISEKHHFLPRF
jgi:hypothetical protein